MQLTKMHELIKLAYRKGYRVTEDGKMMGLKGEKTVNLPPSRQYPRFTFYAGKEYSKNGAYGIPIHSFAAYCFYGEEMFNNDVEVRHLNGNILDFSRSNIALGTKQENEDDKTKETRARVGKINSIKRKGIRPANAKFSIEEVLDIKSRIANGDSNSSIAKFYNVHRNNIRNIKIGESYKDVINK